MQHITPPAISLPNVQFHPNQDIAISASEDGTARVWDLSTGRCTKALEGHNKKYEVLRACWAPPGTAGEAVALATGSADGTVRLWGVPSNGESSGDDGRGGGGGDSTGVERYHALKVVGQLRHRNEAKGLDGQVYSCQFIPSHGNASGASSSSAGTMHLLTASDSSVHLWDVATRQRVSSRALSKVGEHSIGGERNPDDLSFIFDAKPRPLSGSSVLAVALSDGTVRVGDVLGESGQIEVLKGPSNTHLTSLAWSDDGTILVSCGGDGTVTVWDTRTWTVRAVLSGHSRPVYGATFYPCGGEDAGQFSSHVLLSWSSDESICAWDARRASGDGTAPLATLCVERGFPIYNCSVSADRRRLAVAGGGGGGKAGFLGVPIKLVELSDEETASDGKGEPLAGGGSTDALG